MGTKAVTKLDGVLRVSTRIGLDTAPFIYYIEEHPQYLSLIEPLFTAIDRDKSDRRNIHRGILSVPILP